jgi:hypothetical protein
MGRYINKTSKEYMLASFHEKCRALENDGAIPINRPEEWVDQNLVVVVDNGAFAAAAYCFSSYEFHRMTDPRDTRTTQWYIWDKVEKFAE